MSRAMWVHELLSTEGPMRRAEICRRLCDEYRPAGVEERRLNWSRARGATLVEAMELHGLVRRVRNEVGETVYEAVAA